MASAAPPTPDGAADAMRLWGQAAGASPNGPCGPYAATSV